MNLQDKINEAKGRIKYMVGIDPSFTKMGVAILDPLEKDINKGLKMKRGEFLDMVKWINQNCKLSEVVAVVENPNLDSNVFGMFAMMKDEIKKWVKSGMKNWGGLQATFGICMRRAQDVGKSKASGQMIIKMLRDKGVLVVEIKPSSRDKAFKKKNGKIERIEAVKMLTMPTKTTQKQFEKFCGFNGSSNEDSRDAATMIVGRSRLWAIQSALFELEQESKRPDSYPSSSNGNRFLISRESKIF